MAKKLLINLLDIHPNGRLLFSNPFLRFQGDLEDKKLIEKWDRVTGYILLFIGVITAWSSTHLSMGKFKHPGPGFLPFGLAIVLILIALILIISRWQKDAPPVPFWPEKTWLRPLLGVAIFALYAILLGRVGFLITTFAFLLIWMGVIEQMRWVTMISISVVVTATLY